MKTIATIYAAVIDEHPDSKPLEQLRLAKTRLLQQNPSKEDLKFIDTLIDQSTGFAKKELRSRNGESVLLFGTSDSNADEFYEYYAGERDDPLTAEQVVRSTMLVLVSVASRAGWDDEEDVPATIDAIAAQITLTHPKGMRAELAVKMTWEDRAELDTELRVTRGSESIVLTDYRKIVEELHGALTFGERLKADRATLALNQAELATELGTTAATISRWEKDQSLPSDKYIPVLNELNLPTP